MFISHFGLGHINGVTSFKNCWGKVFCFVLGLFFIPESR